MNRTSIIAAAALLLAGCGTTTSIKQAQRTPDRISAVCIERNADVLSADLLPAIESAFARNGIQTRVVSVESTPCPYRVTYTGSRRWDGVFFLSDARISLFHNRDLIGEAMYSLPSGIFGGGGISPNKWRGASYKIDPLMDQMLAGAK